MLYTQLFLNFQPKTELFAGLKAPVKSVVFAFFWVCLLIGSTATASGLPDVSLKTPPDLKVEIMDVDGRPVTLADYQGTPLLVNFWAIWCPPCVAELPALERAVASFDEQSVKVLLVSVDRGGAKKLFPFWRPMASAVPTLPLIQRVFCLATSRCGACQQLFCCRQIRQNPGHLLVLSSGTRRRCSKTLRRFCHNKALKQIKAAAGAAFIF